MSSERFYINSFHDSKEKNSCIENGLIKPEFASILHDNACKLLAILERSGNLKINSGDYSVYTGSTGIALLYYFLSRVSLPTIDSQIYLQKCRDYLDFILSKLKSRTVTFLCGDAGPLTLGILVYETLGDKERASACWQRLLNICTGALTLSPDMPNECLYGRAGFLYALLMLRNEMELGIPSSSVVSTVELSRIIYQLGQTIIAEGQSCATSTSPPLVYSWHGSYYVGGAHGFAGILYYLMQPGVCTKEQLEQLVRPTVDFILSQRFESGNLPSSLDKERDTLVQWCHGAPGCIHMAVRALQLWPDAHHYGTYAMDMCNVTWERGLLRKGCGLCHGSAGNAYTFLTMFNALSKDSQVERDRCLYRAVKFAEWCFEFDRNQDCPADRPFSLMEGLAGTIYFLFDLLRPENAKFPTYEV